MLKTDFIDIHTHTEKSGENLLQIINLNLESPCPEQGHYSYGIHPWALDKAEFQMDEALNKLQEYLQQPQVVALGEAGLDKFHADFDRQIKVFERQIVLSENMHIPMILHDVRSHNEIIALRKKNKAQQPWILHGFNGTMQDARQLIGQGIYLSAGESLLHPERKIYKALKSLDLDYLFLETDMAEIGIEKVYDAAAKALDLDMDALKLRMMDNFMRVFKANFDSTFQLS